MNRLGLNYHCISPDIDESPRGEIHADDLAKRLAFEKAKIIAKDHPNAIVIGSDQVAWREHAPQEFIWQVLNCGQCCSSVTSQFRSECLFQYCAECATSRLRFRTHFG